MIPRTTHGRPGTHCRIQIGQARIHIHETSQRHSHNCMCIDFASQNRDVPLVLLRWRSTRLQHMLYAGGSIFSKARSQRLTSTSAHLTHLKLDPSNRLSIGNSKIRIQSGVSMIDASISLCWRINHSLKIMNQHGALRAKACWFNASGQASNLFHSSTLAGLHPGFQISRVRGGWQGRDEVRRTKEAVAIEVMVRPRATCNCQRNRGGNGAVKGIADASGRNKLGTEMEAGLWWRGWQRAQDVYPRHLLSNPCVTHSSVSIPGCPTLEIQSQRRPASGNLRNDDLPPEVRVEDKPKTFGHDVVRELKRLEETVPRVKLQASPYLPLPTPILLRTAETLMAQKFSPFTRASHCWNSRSRMGPSSPVGEV